MPVPVRIPTPLRRGRGSVTDRTRGFGTRAARGGEGRKNAHDAVTQPIVCTSTYAFDDTAEIRDHFEGRIRDEEYGRYGNPTVRTAERKIADLDGSEDCVLFSSGMAAATTRGAKTLELRVRRQNETALRVARWLEAHPRVARADLDNAFAVSEIP